MSNVSSAIFPLSDPTGAPDWMITDPGTYAGEWQENLAGMTALACQIRFMVGTAGGGAAVNAYLQSSLDQGNTAYDVAVVDFNGGVSRSVALSIMQSTAEPTDQQEAGTTAEGISMAVLGDRLRLKLVVTGPFTNTTPSGRFVAA